MNKEKYYTIQQQEENIIRFEINIKPANSFQKTLLLGMLQEMFKAFILHNSHRRNIIRFNKIK